MDRTVCNGLVVLARGGVFNHAADQTSMGNGNHIRVRIHKRKLVQSRERPGRHGLTRFSTRNLGSWGIQMIQVLTIRSFGVPIVALDQTLNNRWLRHPQASGNDAGGVPGP
jgi:hypothetical protein